MSASDVPTATEAFRADPIPTTNGAADTGCLDEPGRLRAHAEDWHPNAAAGSLILGGAVRTEVVESDRFQAAARAAVLAVAPTATASTRVEFRRTEEGCVTHRYAVFAVGAEADRDGEMVISAWRLEAAARPGWIPNDAGFRVGGDQLLISSGSLMSVVLRVAPDGTTVRVTAYGAHARDLVAGWPTTVVPNPATVAEPTQFTPDQLEPIASAVLAEVLGSRPGG